MSKNVFKPFLPFKNPVKSFNINMKRQTGLNKIQKTAILNIPNDLIKKTNLTNL